MFFKQFIPKPIFQIYHFTMAILATVFYRWPSEQMIVIGVTGTNGKSTVVNLIAAILEEANFKVGLTSTVNFRIGRQELVNNTKMTMLGRFGLQRILRQMVEAGCQYAIVETSSEGIAQFRHIGINYDVAVFVNLSPEHIERHGSFETYKKMKEKLFKSLASGKTKNLFGKKIEKVSVANLDDKYADDFLRFKSDKKYGFHMEGQRRAVISAENVKIIEGKDVHVELDGSSFRIQNSTFKIQLLGAFNIHNALAAICVGLSQDIGMKMMENALKKVKGIPGRMERIDEGQEFFVFVDYAHNPEALSKTYQTLAQFKGAGARMIGVLGAAGGGRDKWKRPEMGRLAARYCDYVIITNEDPYDEKPEEIINEIAAGVASSKLKVESSKLSKILDRREAIKKALSLAKPSDIVIITGKGCEGCIMGRNGTREPWSEEKVIKELLREIKK